MTLTQTDAEGRRAWPVRLWRWTGSRHTTLRTAILTFALVGFSFVLIRQVDNAAADRDSAQAIYQADLSSYENARDEWERCIAAVAARLVTREEAFAQVRYTDSVVAVIAANAGGLPPELDAALDENRLKRLAEIDENRPVLDPADCGAEPTPPVPPED
jgi:hypothetical protein